ncbi:MAG: nucleoside 2-deoxyribosyltransferase [Pseudomonadota bacterium]
MNGGGAPVRRVYLAGPDVFLPDARDVARRKLKACADAGIEGVFPFDIDASPSSSGGFDDGVAIARANFDLMRGADAVLANCTPFRGIHADAGTAFELGFFAAQGKPIHAYSAEGRDAATRTRALLGLADGAEVDADGAAVEDFGHPDNLMLSGAAALTGGAWTVVADGDPAAMAAFHLALDRLAATFGDRAAA